MSHKKREAVALRFPSVPSIELPASHAKHRQIVSQVLKDLRKLGEDQGLKIDLTGAGRPKKADLRSALHRAAKKEGSGAPESFSRAHDRRARAGAQLRDRQPADPRPAGGGRDRAGRDGFVARATMAMVCSGHSRIAIDRAACLRLRCRDAAVARVAGDLQRDGPGNEAGSHRAGHADSISDDARRNAVGCGSANCHHYFSRQPGD